MKRGKCWLTLAAALCALAALVTTVQAAEENLLIEYCESVPEDRNGLTASLLETAWDASYTCYGDQLTGDAKVIYQAMETAFQNGDLPQETLTFSNGTSGQYWIIDDVVTNTWSRTNDVNTIISNWYRALSESAVLACTAFLYDHPEYFWIRTAYAYGYELPYYNNTEITASFYIGLQTQPTCDTTEKCETLQNQLTPVIQQLLHETENMPVVARLAYWDNWLAAHNDYNSTAAKTANYAAVDDTPWSIVGALLDGYSPVCEGYAKAFQLLCHEIGVPCLTISGIANGDGHMWTAVRFDGAWYLCDVTFDDPIYNNAATYDYSSRNYFLTAQTAKHTVSMSLATPTISSTNYFSGWNLSHSGIAGGEQTTGNLLMALYTSSGQMIACGACTAFEWINNGTTSYMYLAPEFDASLLAQADRVVRFRLAASTYAPLSAVKMISAG